MKPFLYILLFATLLIAISCKKSKPETVPEPKPWDGRYRVEGMLTDLKESQITYAGPQEFHLKPVTDGNIEVHSKEVGIIAHLIKHGSNFSYYGTFGLVLRIDPASNKITFLTNFYGQPSSSGRSAVLDPSGVNSFDPATKNICIKYWMDEVGFMGHRTAFDETWTYIGAR